MRSLSSSLLVVLVALLGGAACKGEPFRPDAGPLEDSRPTVDAYEPPWFTPQPGEAKNWDVQLNAPFDLSADRTMMVLSLWNVVPAETTLTYADGSMLTVPAGSQPTAIAELHAKGTKVICHVNSGAIRLTDPDAMKFPGYEADPPNRPTPPAEGSVIGWSTTATDASERFIDIRAGARATVMPLIFARYDLAEQIGCDGVLADNIDAVAYEGAAGIGHGFDTIDITEHTSWNEEVAKQAHQRELSAGMQNGHYVADQPDALSDDYDWILVERCGELDECDFTRPFINRDKAVFAIDYDEDVDGVTLDATIPCARWPEAMIQDGILKTAALDKTRAICP